MATRKTTGSSGGDGTQESRAAKAADKGIYNGDHLSNVNGLMIGDLLNGRQEPGICRGVVGASHVMLRAAALRERHGRLVNGRRVLELTPED